jgi:nicotinamide-nucleotide amidase
MKAEIITIGDEILIGQTIDTNSAWIGSELTRIGFDIQQKSSIHDSREAILQSLQNIKADTDVVLITGGLGPTSDDLTKPVLCEFFNTRLVSDKRVLESISTMMSRTGWQMNENNRKQAEVPESCTVLDNAVGTAPGMRFEKEGKYYISLPGVPNEMKYIMTAHVIPWLKDTFKSQAIIHKNIMTYGLGEAILAERLTGFENGLPSGIKLAYLPSLGVIKLRLSATGSDKNSIEKLTDEQVKKLYGIIPDLIYAEDEESFEMVIGRILKKRGETISTAESCTGGKIAQMLTSVPGSSDYYKGSVIAYDNEIKIRLLDVPGEIIEKHGAVSREAVEKMAEGVRALMKTDFALATSGIAGPGGGTAEKPVGLVWIAFASAMGTVSGKYMYGNDRNTTISRFSVAALNLAYRQIIKLNQDSDPYVEKKED